MHTSILYVYFMLISEQYPDFKNKTLVVVADHAHAKLFVGENRDFTFVEELKTDYPPQDGERSSMMTPSGRHSAETPEHESEIGADHLFHTLAKDLHARLERDEFEDLILAAGPEVHQLENLLHADVRAHVTHLIPKILTKMNDEEILEHLWA